MDLLFVVATVLLGVFGVRTLRGLLGASGDEDRTRVWIDAWILLTAAPIAVAAFFDHPTVSLIAAAVALPAAGGAFLQSRRLGQQRARALARQAESAGSVVERMDALEVREAQFSRQSLRTRIGHLIIKVLLFGTFIGVLPLITDPGMLGFNAALIAVFGFFVARDVVRIRVHLRNRREIEAEMEMLLAASEHTSGEVAASSRGRSPSDSGPPDDEDE